MALAGVSKTFGSVAALFLLIALIAGYFPARRAIRVDPGAERHDELVDDGDERVHDTSAHAQSTRTTEAASCVVAPATMLPISDATGRPSLR